MKRSQELFLEADEKFRAAEALLPLAQKFKEEGRFFTAVAKMDNAIKLRDEAKLLRRRALSLEQQILGKQACIILRYST